MNVKIYSCKECGQSFCQKSYLQTHEFKHTELSPFVCDVCNKQFNSADRRNLHKKFVHENKNFKCETCEKTTFLRKTDFTKHKKVHTGEKSKLII